MMFEAAVNGCPRLSRRCSGARMRVGVVPGRYASCSIHRRLRDRGSRRMRCTSMKVPEGFSVLASPERARVIRARISERMSVLSKLRILSFLARRNHDDDAMMTS